MQVATNYLYKNREGQAIVETTWHNIVAFESKRIQGLDRLHKGSRVPILGRLRNTRYTTISGEKRSFMEILASDMEVMDEE